MTPFVRQILSPVTMRKAQDGLFALMATGVAVTFMLFLLGSTDILTSLSIIGVLLCLSLVGSVLRFFSMTRADTALGERQDDFDKTLLILQHRVGDHDLTLLEMAGKIEQVESSVQDLREVHEKTTRQQNLFLQTIKNRIVQMMTTMGQMRQQAALPAATGAPAPASKKSKAFIPGRKALANDAPQGTESHTATNEDDVYVSPTLIREAVAAAIEQKRIDLYMQPIVTLPQRRAVAYELYGRVRLQPGVYIPATQYRGVSLHGGMQVALDHLVLSELGRLYATLPDAQIFMNICAEALTNPATLGLMTRLLKQNPRLRSRLVLELAQRDCSRLSAAQTRVMRELQKIGVSFAVNDVQGMELDLDLLADMNIRFLKLPYGRLITTQRSDQGTALIHRFMTRLRTRGIQLIAAHIETADQIRNMLDYPIVYAQGHLFGRPDRPIAYHLKNGQKVA